MVKDSSAHVPDLLADGRHMEVSSSHAQVRDVYGRMRRLSEAIQDPDSSVGQRRRWSEEYTQLSVDLTGSVGARKAAGAELLDRVTRRLEMPDGHTPRVGPPTDGRKDMYL